MLNLVKNWLTAQNILFFSVIFFWFCSNKKWQITNYLNKFTISNCRTKTSRHSSKMSVTVFTEGNAPWPLNNCMPQVFFLSSSLGLYIILSEPSSETNGHSAGWVGRKGGKKFFKHVRTSVVEISFHGSESSSNKVQCSCAELL